MGARLDGVHGEQLGQLRRSAAGRLISPPRNFSPHIFPIKKQLKNPTAAAPLCPPSGAPPPTPQPPHNPSPPFFSLSLSVIQPSLKRSLAVYSSFSRCRCGTNPPDQSALSSAADRRTPRPSGYRRPIPGSRPHSLIYLFIYYYFIYFSRLFKLYLFIYFFRLYLSTYPTLFIYFFLLYLFIFSYFIYLFFPTLFIFFYFIYFLPSSCQSPGQWEKHASPALLSPPPCLSPSLALALPLSLPLFLPLQP